MYNYLCNIHIIGRDIAVIKVLDVNQIDVLKISYKPIFDDIEKVIELQNSIRTMVNTGNNIKDIRDKSDEIGNALFNMIFPDEIRNKFEEFYNNTHRVIHFILTIDDDKIPEISSLPWEFMCSPDHLQSKPLYYAIDNRVVFSRQRGKIKEDFTYNSIFRIVLVVSNPESDSHGKNILAIDYEKLLKQISQIEFNNRKTIVELHTGASADIIRGILKDTPDIFHFIGHSRMIDNKHQVLLMDNHIPYMGEWIDDKFFAMLFDEFERKPRFVILQSCESASQSIDKPMKGIASRILQVGVRNVLAMQYEISNARASEFMINFYQHLQKYSIGQSVQKARRKLMFESIREDVLSNFIDFASPVIWMNGGDYNILPDIEFNIINAYNPDENVIKLTPEEQNVISYLYMAHAPLKLGWLSDYINERAKISLFKVIVDKLIIKGIVRVSKDAYISLVENIADMNISNIHRSLIDENDFHEKAAKYFYSKRKYFLSIKHWISIGEFREASKIMFDYFDYIKRDVSRIELDNLMKEFPANDFENMDKLAEFKILHAKISISRYEATRLASEAVISAIDFSIGIEARYAYARSLQQFNTKICIDAYGIAIKYYIDNQIDYTKILMRIYIDRAWVYIRDLNDLENARKDIEEFKNISVGGIDDYTNFMYANIMAEMLYLEGDFEKALEIQKNSLDSIALSHYNDDMICKQRHNYGIALRDKADQETSKLRRKRGFENAKKEIQKAYEQAEELDDSYLRILCLESLGGCFFYLEEYEKAENCYLSALKIAECDEDKIGIVNNNVNLTEVYAVMGDYRKSLYYFNEAKNAFALHAKGCKNAYDLLNYISFIYKGFIPPYIEDDQINDRQKRAFDEIKDKKNISTKEYADLFGVSLVIARRELKEMTDKKLLVVLEKGKKKIYALNFNP